LPAIRRSEFSRSLLYALCHTCPYGFVRIQRSLTLALRLTVRWR
jgi:hypothetical protein